jgi:hypothetical protein
MIRKLACVAAALALSGCAFKNEVDASGKPDIGVAPGMTYVDFPTHSGTPEVTIENAGRGDIRQALIRAMRAEDFYLTDQFEYVMTFEKAETRANRTWLIPANVERDYKIKFDITPLTGGRTHIVSGSLTYADLGKDNHIDLSHSAPQALALQVILNRVSDELNPPPDMR